MTDLLIADRAKRALDDALSGGATAGGWLLSGPQGVGKASVGRAFVAAHLSGAGALEEADPRIAKLVAEEAHPDLLVLRRRENEKTGRLRAEIAVDDVREATGRLFRTSATGRRAVMVDLADDLGRSGANALLKSLEEPPAGTLFLLLSRAPGRLLPTIRSRCRALPLPPIGEDVLAAWLRERTGADEAAAREVARLSGGAPGRALSLSDGDGTARTLAEQFLSAAAGRGDLLQVAEAAGTRANDQAWPEAWQIVTDRVGAVLRGAEDPVLSAHAGPRLLAALDEARALSARAEGLKADRTQAALVLGRTLGRALRAGR